MKINNPPQIQNIISDTPLNGKNHCTYGGINKRQRKPIRPANKRMKINLIIDILH